MAERRMFAKSVINAARFLRMPASARLLYYDLGMAADDDGVVEAFTVLRTTGAAEADLQELVSRGFVTILNDDLVAYITDWKRNNQIKADRYRASIYADMLAEVTGEAQPEVVQNPSANRQEPEQNSAATDMEPEWNPTGTTLEPEWNPTGTTLEPEWNPTGTTLEPQVRLGKDRLGKDRLDKDRLDKDRSGESSPDQDKKNRGESGADKSAPAPAHRRFIKPSVEDVRQYAAENGYAIDAQRFVDYYDSNGWHVGRSAMKNWQAAVRSWARRDTGNAQQPRPPVRPEDDVLAAFG